MSEGIDIQGGLLTRDFLDRLRIGDVPGAKPADYVVPGRLDDAVTSAWGHLHHAWQLFQVQKSRVKEGDKEEAYRVTKDAWLKFVFDELRYGYLTERTPLSIEGKVYPIKFSFNGVPIEVVGYDQDLDIGPSGTAKGNPHSQLQEYLNRTKSDAWGILTNGHVWRILRNNASNPRPAYIEFDLQSVMAKFDEFAIWWRIAHSTRIAGIGIEGCWLERWMLDADRQGTRALVHLRKGVEEAIEELGRGFLKHPRNETLRSKLRDGLLSPQEYYRQVLQLVYRLIFLFVTEDRTSDGKPLLLNPKANPEIRRLYLDNYSTRRLRRLAHEMRGSQHHDAFEAFKVIVRALKDPAGAKALGIVGLNGSLWSNDFCTDLEEVHLRNLHFFQAIRRLTRIQRGNGPVQAVDYQRLDSEELGSVYEALLELVPAVNPNERTFNLVAAAGNERKTTGSYYTPTSIIGMMLDHSLEPLLDEACSKAEPERAILGLKICDPTCGSGHFLVAAARRIARRLATLRTGEMEPGLQAVRHAVRDVIAHCIYGVDINPMAVELCKVSLWLEAMDPGKPLTFLEHKIQCGNAVVGATPLLLRNRLPDAAFNPVEGDDKAAARYYRDLNREHLLKQVTLHGFKGVVDPEFHAQLVKDIQAIETLSDDTVSNIQEKERKLAQHKRTQKFAKEYADAWCAAFFQVKQANDPHILTQETLNHILEDPELVAQEQWQRIEALRQEYNFFHWHLAFPEVFGLPPPKSSEHYEGGFQLILGNPPWDTLSPDEKEFFSQYDPAFRTSDDEYREAVMARLLAVPAIAAAWRSSRRRLYSSVQFYKQSGRYTLFAPGNLGKGDFNLFRIISEHSMRATAPAGYYSQVLPDNMYLGANCMALREHLFKAFELQYLVSYINHGEVWFADIDERTKFCSVIARRGGPTDKFRVAFRLDDEAQLRDLSIRSVQLSVALVREFSPDALQISELDGPQDIVIAQRMYERCPKFEASAYFTESPYMREVDMGNDKELFHDTGELPVYEGRMVWHFDHRAKGYVSGRGRAAEWKDYTFADPGKRIQPQWWIKKGEIPKKLVSRIQKYRVGFLDVAGPGNERTLAAAVIPPAGICGDKVPTVLFRETWMHLVYAAVANSIPMDWLSRAKVSLKMSYTIMDTLPFPNLSRNHALTKQLVERAARLTCVSAEMDALWSTLSSEGWVPKDRGEPVLDADSRLRLECELHAIVAKCVYGLTREQLEYQFRRFDVLERKDTKAFRSFRTKEWSLAAFDALPSDFPVATREELWGPIAGGQPTKSKGQLTLLEASSAESRGD